MNIVLLGSPASGKGTQANLLCERYGLYHLSTGEVARKIAQKDQRIKEIIDSGKLIPAEEMTMHVINFLSNEKPDLKNILFEGFPRFISQFEALSNFLISKGDDIDLVISLEVGEKEAIKRISSRRVCESCGENFNLITKPSKLVGKCDKCNSNLIQRKDDNENSVKVRFEYYKNNTKELIDYVDNLGKLTRINGERPVDEIQRDLVDLIERMKNEKNIN